MVGSIARQCALALVVLLAAVAPASATPYLYVSHGTNDVVDVVDVASGRLHDQWKGGRLPKRATLNHDHTRVYVLNEQDSDLSIFDARTAELLHTVDLGGVPLSIAIPDNDAKVYVGLADSVLGEIGAVGHPRVTGQSYAVREQWRRRHGVRRLIRSVEAQAACERPAQEARRPRSRSRQADPSIHVRAIRSSGNSHQ